MNSSSGALRLKGLVGSATALTLAALFNSGNRDFLLVQDDAEQAAYLFHDLNQLLGRDRVLLFPSSYRRRIGKGLEDAGNIILRTEVLNALQASSREALVIVSYPEALAEKVLSQQELNNNTLKIKTGEQIDNRFVVEMLNEYGFERTDYVYEPGQYAQRGSLIDVYSWAYELPFRIDFFGNEIESIRSFEVESQLSSSLFSEVNIILHQQSNKGEHFVSIVEYLGEKALMAFSGLDYCCKRMELVVEDLSTFSEAYLLAETSELIQAAKSTNYLEYGSGLSGEQQTEIQFNCSHQEKFSKRFDLLAGHLQKYKKEGYQLCILSNNAKQLDRITAIFEERQQQIAFNPILQTLHEGFCDHELKLLCYTDHQLFDRFHKYSLRSDQARSGKLALSMKELMQFQFGDYVVHIDHGVGRFGGLFRTEINGKMQEIIKITYKDNDTIFVSIHNLHRISKYRGKEGLEPTIHKLGSGAWERIKNRSKSKIKDIARDLIKLYSHRMQEKGFAYSPDSYLQQALEASFIYEDTPDQLKATADVKKDMELDKPMDRLICGDVGFGKTEVAIRAAFKAVCDNKQVAVLVPTT
ncbi:MAG: transcription-repair coupling factor, partial [Bacteroidales bacterium]|nr:transcription-repair coupling factor [Bacteroidales bacterium]